MVICIPTYNTSKTIIETLESINSQTYKNFEVIVSDNNSEDNTVAKVMDYMQHHDMIIHVYIHNENVGCGGNLNRLFEYAKEDILFFMAADDVLVGNVLELYAKAFEDPKVGVVGRYYYWFEKDPKVPVRFKRSLHFIALCDQISGIAIRKQYIRNYFTRNPFVEIVSVVYPLMKICKTYLIEQDTVAVRSDNNPYYTSGWAFNKSPTMLWYNIIKDNDFLVDELLAHNFIGLVQIKNYGRYYQLFKEIGWLIRLDLLNLLNPKFWFFCLGCLLTPSFILRRLTKWLKPYLYLDWNKRAKEIWEKI